MPRSKHVRTVQHFAAMQLILSMQETVNGEITYPNIPYVVDRDRDQRMVPENDIIHGLKFMRDLLTMVDPVVYTAFRDAIRSGLMVDGVRLTDASLKDSLHAGMSFLHKVSSQAETEMWQDPPHPCYFITREVVAELLAQ